jgi:hypothetical protein
MQMRKLRDKLLSRKEVIINFERGKHMGGSRKPSYIFTVYDPNPSLEVKSIFWSVRAFCCRQITKQ